MRTGPTSSVTPTLGRAPSRAVQLAASALVLAGCQDNVSTPFPEGLEPLEVNEIVDADGPPTEELRAMSIGGDPIRVHGRGFVFTDPARLWALTQQPAAMVARCSTDEQQVSTMNEPSYEFSFLVHYVVRMVLTVEWDDAWRYGIVTDEPMLGMIKHQKTQGSDFITISTGTIQVLATADPGISELAFVEHLDAVSGSASDVLNGMRDNYARLVALAHDASQPGCP